jgi:hypothetical protein
MKKGLLLLLLIQFTVAYSQNTSTLFENEESLTFSIKTDIRELIKDRGDNPDYHKAVMSFGTTVSFPLKIKVRGNFRKQMSNCFFPPILLNFDRSNENSGLFTGENKLKLITKCKTDEYVLREYMVYKVYNLISPLSFNARLALVKFLDSDEIKKPYTQLNFLLEDEEKLAKRLNMKEMGEKLIMENRIELHNMATVAVFEYLIGNTDWSVPYRHNIKILEDSIGRAIAIPYDFDHSGLMNATYAKPSEALGILSILQRLYRGLPYDRYVFHSVFENFKSAKKDIYALYENNTELSPKYIKFVVHFLDEFYETISDEKAIEKEFYSEKSQLNVKIKGLK